jgi:hypothetical protein
MADSLEDLAAIPAGLIHLGLTDLDDVDAERPQRLTERRLEAVSPARVLAGWIRDLGQRPADVLGERIGHICGDLAEAIEVVPRQDVAAGHAAPPEFLGHEMGNQDLPQVAQVDRTRRADS